MTEEEAVELLKKCKEMDTESGHFEADTIISNFLYINGYEEVAFAYNAVKKWYAWALLVPIQWVGTMEHSGS